MTNRRLRLAAATRAKISQSLTGHSTSEETRAKISQSLKGRPKSAETRAKMSAAHSRPSLDPIQACRASVRERHRAVRARRYAQWQRDLDEAWKLSKALFLDVLASKGWYRYRRLKDVTGKVSHGWGAPTQKTVHLAPVNATP